MSETIILLVCVDGEYEFICECPISMTVADFMKKLEVDLLQFFVTGESTKIFRIQTSLRADVPVKYRLGEIFDQGDLVFPLRNVAKIERIKSQEDPKTKTKDETKTTTSSAGSTDFECSYQSSEPYKTLKSHIEIPQSSPQESSISVQSLFKLVPLFLDFIRGKERGTPNKYGNKVDPKNVNINTENRVINGNLDEKDINNQNPQATTSMDSDRRKKVLSTSFKNSDPSTTVVRQIFMSNSDIATASRQFYFPNQGKQNNNYEKNNIEFRNSTNCSNTLTEDQKENDNNLKSNSYLSENTCDYSVMKDFIVCGKRKGVDGEMLYELSSYDTEGEKSQEFNEINFESKKIPGLQRIIPNNTTLESGGNSLCLNGTSIESSANNNSNYSYSDNNNDSAMIHNSIESVNPQNFGIMNNRIYQNIHQIPRPIAANEQFMKPPIGNMANSIISNGTNVNQGANIQTYLNTSIGGINNTNSTNPSVGVSTIQSNGNTRNINNRNTIKPIKPGRATTKCFPYCKPLAPYKCFDKRCEICGAIVAFAPTPPSVLDCTPLCVANTRKQKSKGSDFCSICMGRRRKEAYDPDMRHQCKECLRPWMILNENGICRTCHSRDHKNTGIFKPVNMNPRSLNQGK